MTHKWLCVVVFGALFTVGCTAAQKMVARTSPSETFQEKTAYDATGTAVKVKGNEVTLAREGLPAMMLEVEGRTRVTLNGYQSSAKAIPEGGMVRAKFQIVDNRPVAVRLDVSSTHEPQTEQPGQP